MAHSYGAVAVVVASGAINLLVTTQSTAQRMMTGLAQEVVSASNLITTGRGNTGYARACSSTTSSILAIHTMHLNTKNAFVLAKSKRIRKAAHELPQLISCGQACGAEQHAVPLKLLHRFFCQR